jgi:hypothetical protein
MAFQRDARVRILRRPLRLAVEDRARLRVDVVLVEAGQHRVARHILLEVRGGASLARFWAS